jgi:oxalate decarboxylase/phosphoglucose isomerase-like protein (cupin superfamily)
VRGVPSRVASPSFAGGPICPPTERRLQAWDFVHCPPGTEHVFVGAGDGPCFIFMTGRRTADRGIVYPRSDLARSYGAGVETETRSPSEAYARVPHWQPERPKTGFPWA